MVIFPLKMVIFPIKNGDFSIKNSEFPMKNGDFHSYVKLPEKIDLSTHIVTINMVVKKSFSRKTRFQ